ncbi:MAG TPA: hypothetical protein VGF95_15710 [Solirubrobacteraceae bacterium]
MLFDLRGRGRRRTVQTIYLGLALLMALGLIGLGIGGGFGGGNVIESLTKEEKGASSFTKEIAAAKKSIHKDPSNGAAWAKLAEAQLHEASPSNSEVYDEATSRYTSKGKELLHHAANSWTHYLNLEKSPTNYTLARQMTHVYSAEGLDEPKNVVQALQIVISDPKQPASAALYENLAEYAYLAHNNGLGDLASKKAVSLTPKTRRPLLELEFEKLKKGIEEEAASSSTGSVTTGGTSATSGAGSNVTVTPSSTGSGKSSSGESSSGKAASGESSSGGSSSGKASSGSGKSSGGK